jgi:hypothetical protein
MFDRNRSANSIETTDEAVRLVLVDGSDLNGHIALPATARLDTFINNADRFLAFTDHDGQMRFVAKDQIAALRPVAAPRANQLSRRLADGTSFNPYEILGLEPGAGPEAVRQAWLMMARLYHPDRFAGTDLPREVAAYLKAMQQRANLAYEALTGNKAAAA